jgi:hypothetical protein
VCTSGRHVSAFVPVCIDEFAHSNIQAAHVGLLVHESILRPLVWLVGRWDRSLTHLVLNKDLDYTRRGQSGYFTGEFSRLLVTCVIFLETCVVHRTSRLQLLLYNLFPLRAIVATIGVPVSNTCFGQ